MQVLLCGSGGSSQRSRNNLVAVTLYSFPAPYSKYEGPYISSGSRLLVGLRLLQAPLRAAVFVCPSLRDVQVLTA